MLEKEKNKTQPKKPPQTDTKKKRKKATFKLHKQSEDTFKDPPYPQTMKLTTVTIFTRNQHI